MKFTHKISAYLKSANWIKSSWEAGKKWNGKKEREKFLPSPVYFALHHVNVSFCPAKSFRHLFPTPFFDLVMCWKTKFLEYRIKKRNKKKFSKVEWEVYKMSSNLVNQSSEHLFYSNNSNLKGGGRDVLYHRPKNCLPRVNVMFLVWL